MTVAIKTLFRAAAAAASLLPFARAQQPIDCGYPERDILSPFRTPTDVYAPPDELFRNLRIMKNLAAKFPDRCSFDSRGREIVDHDVWRQAYEKVQSIGLDAGVLAQMMRLHRDNGQRDTAFFAGFYCANIGYVMELISHIPGEPIRATREQAFRRAIEFLRANLGRKFGELSDDERAVVMANMPEIGSPVAKSRGITRAPRDGDHLHSLRMAPFFQLLDAEESIDHAQALWFLKEVFKIRLDMANAWLEPALPRIRQLLGSDDPQVRKEAIELFQVVGPKDLPPPPEDADALVAWAETAGKHLFPPIRNLNDAIVQLFPSAERDAIAAAAIAALENSSIGDPFRGQTDDGQWYAGYRIARVPDALKPLAIPAEAVITAVNGVTILDAESLVATARKQLKRPRPTRVFVEYVHRGKAHAIEYRVM
ncbi:MAG: hypothetical protein KAI24_23860 [Planctomycetes bacterium]|nr:hypothetical protein [Planctomycetota bacterium]